jgi:hypothetical protein
VNAEYKRDLQNNYLILELQSDQEEDSFQLRMAQQNKIQGLLSFHSSGTDGKRYLHYEITSKQPLADLYEKKMMSSRDITALLSGISVILESMQKYLLQPSQLIFDPQYMFVEPGRGQIWLCYLPDGKNDAPIALLAEFILKRLDHEEPQAVNLGYSFYQKTIEENFSLQQSLRELLRTEEAMPSARPQGNPAAQEAEAFHAGSRRDYSAENGTANNETNLYFGSSETEAEGYEVTHRQRHSKRKRQAEVDAGEKEPIGKSTLPEKEGRKKKKTEKKGIDRLFQIIHPAVLLSTLVLLVVLELLFWFGIIHLTEAGGLFFLLISIEILINQAWRKSSEKKKKEENRWVEEEEDERYRILQNELYEKGPDVPPIEETRCLMPEEEEKGIRLRPLTEAEIPGGYPEIRLGPVPVFVGKIEGESDLILNTSTVSRMHARLECREGIYYVRDLNSKNGTFVNGERLYPQEQREIRPGDCIAFAQIEYQVIG